MGMKYVGAGAYIHGVPARDLTDEEADRHGALIAEQQAVSGMTLYVATEKRTSAPKADAKATQKEGG